MFSTFCLDTKGSPKGQVAGKLLPPKAILPPEKQKLVLRPQTVCFSTASSTDWVPVKVFEGDEGIRFQGTSFFASGISFFESLL